MVHNATVSDIDWKLTPFVTVYDGLISTLKILDTRRIQISGSIIMIGAKIYQTQLVV